MNIKGTVTAGQVDAEHIPQLLQLRLLNGVFVGRVPVCQQLLGHDILHPP